MQNSPPSHETNIPVVDVMMATRPAQRPTCAYLPATVANISSKVDTLRYLDISAVLGSGEGRTMTGRQLRSAHKLIGLLVWTRQG